MVMRGRLKRAAIEALTLAARASSMVLAPMRELGNVLMAGVFPYGRRPASGATQGRRNAEPFGSGRRS